MVNAPLKDIVELRLNKRVQIGGCSAGSRCRDYKPVLQQSKNAKIKSLTKKIMKLVFDLQPIVNASEEIEIILKADDKVLKERVNLIKNLIKDDFEMEIIEQ